MRRLATPAWSWLTPAIRRDSSRTVGSSIGERGGAGRRGWRERPAPACIGRVASGGPVSNRCPASPSTVNKLLQIRDTRATPGKRVVDIALLLQPCHPEE